jgi:hypothetical protein
MDPKGRKISPIKANKSPTDGTSLDLIWTAETEIKLRGNLSEPS